MRALLRLSLGGAALVTYVVTIQLAVPAGMVLLADKIADLSVR